MINLEIKVDMSPIRGMLGRVAEAMSWAATSAADSIVRVAQRLVRVRTGLLWSKIRYKTRGGWWEAANRLYYASYQHDGTTTITGTFHMARGVEQTNFTAIAQESIRRITG